LEIDRAVFRGDQFGGFGKLQPVGRGYARTMLGSADWGLPPCPVSRLLQGQAATPNQKTVKSSDRNSPEFSLTTANIKSFQRSFLNEIDNMGVTHLETFSYLEHIERSSATEK